MTRNSSQVRVPQLRDMAPAVCELVRLMGFGHGSPLYRSQHCRYLCLQQPMDMHVLPALLGLTFALNAGCCGSIGGSGNVSSRNSLMTSDSYNTSCAVSSSSSTVLQHSIAV